MSPSNHKVAQMISYLRFNDLRDRRIINNRTTLYRWIQERGFPAGILLGPNTRAWAEDEVEAWLAARTADREPKVA